MRAPGRHALPIAFPDARQGFAPFAPADWAVLLFWLLAAHLLGLAHHTARRTDVWETSALRLRQHRLTQSIEEDTKRCEQLLANIIPPHLLTVQAPSRRARTPPAHSSRVQPSRQHALCP